MTKKEALRILTNSLIMTDGIVAPIEMEAAFEACYDKNQSYPGMLRDFLAKLNEVIDYHEENHGLHEDFVKGYRRLAGKIKTRSKVFSGDSKDLADRIIETLESTF